MAENETLTHIEIADIITRPDVADLLGTSPAQVGVMVSRGTDDIPRPVHQSRQGMIFSRRQILAWGARTGRIKDGARL